MPYRYMVFELGPFRLGPLVHVPIRLERGGGVTVPHWLGEWTGGLLLLTWAILHS